MNASAYLAATRCLEAGARLVTVGSHAGANRAMDNQVKLADMEFQLLDEMLVAWVVVPDLRRATECGTK